MSNPCLARQELSNLVYKLLCLSVISFFPCLPEHVCTFELQVLSNLPIQLPILLLTTCIFHIKLLGICWGECQGGSQLVSRTISNFLNVMLQLFMVSYPLSFPNTHKSLSFVWTNRSSFPSITTLYIFSIRLCYVAGLYTPAHYVFDEFFMSHLITM